MIIGLLMKFCQNLRDRIRSLSGEVLLSWMLACDLLWHNILVSLVLTPHLLLPSPFLSVLNKWFNFSSYRYYLFYTASLHVSCAGCWYLLIELLLHLVAWRQTHDNPLRSNPAYSVVKWVNHQKFFCYALSWFGCYFTVNYIFISSITSYELILWFQAVLCWHGWYCPAKGESCFLTSLQRRKYYTHVHSNVRWNTKTNYIWLHRVLRKL